MYHKIRRLYNKYKTEHYKNLLKVFSKQYKNTISKNIRQHKMEQAEKLRKLNSKNPKEYWRILNKETKRHKSAVPVDDFFTFFKQVNNPENKSSQNNHFHNENMSTYTNEEINQPITDNEIIEAVHSLKHNKSPGSDEILNEHIKSTLHIMLPTYVKLFNLVFDKAIVPESWLLGDIIPIYKKKRDVQNPENYRPITLLSCLGKLFT